MSEALIILKPRRIAQSEAAINELPTTLPIIELIGYTEQQLADGIFTAALQLHPHDYYLVASDDLIIHWPAIEAVLDTLNDQQAVTGYCQFTHTDWTINITRKPLQGDQPRQNAYSFLSYHEMIAGPPLRRTWFTGMSLTGMSAQMWETFPFGCYTDDNGKGYSSDFHLSKRLQDAGVPIQAVRDGFCYHWRHEQRHTNDSRDDRLVIGDVEPEIRLR